MGGSLAQQIEARRLLTSADALRAADQGVEAIEVLEHALLLEEVLEPTLAAEVRLKLADCYGERGDHESARTALRPLLDDVPDAVWEARANVRLGRTCFFLGELDSSETLCRSALEALGPTDHHAEVAMALQWLGNALQELGRGGEAREAFRDGVAGARRSGDRYREASCLGSLARLDILESEFPRAIEQLEVCLDLSKELGHRPNMAKAHQSLSVSWFHLGQWERSEEAARSAARLYSDLADIRGQALAQISLCRLIRRRGGDPSEHLEKAARLAADSGFQRARLLVIEERGNLAAAAGDFESAEAHFFQVFEEAETEAPDGDLVYAVAWRLALVVQECGRLEQAETVAALGLERSRRVADRRETGRCLVALARIHDGVRKSEEARREIDEALRIFSELRTPWELAQAHEMAAQLYRSDPYRQRAHRGHARRARRSLGLEGATGTTGRGSAVLTPGEIVAADPASRALLETARELWKFEGVVLIHGETGVGKGRIARLIHESAPYATAPFVRNPMKGHEVEGEGTLFLDDVDKASPTAQVDMLWMIERVREQPYGTRIIAATGRDLHRLVEAGQFLPELYYRLAGYVLEVPALRRRPKDIEAMARAFLEESGHELSDEALAALRHHPWPGNVRELENALDAAAFRAGAERVVRLEHLSPVIAPAEEASASSLPQRIEVLERREIRTALELSGGNKKMAAQILGVSRKGLHDRLKRLDMFEPARRRGGTPS